MNAAATKAMELPSLPETKNLNCAASNRLRTFFLFLAGSLFVWYLFVLLGF